MLAGNSSIRCSVTRLSGKICAAMPSCVSTEVFSIRCPLSKKAWRFDGMSRLPLSKPNLSQSDP